MKIIFIHVLKLIIKQPENLIVVLWFSRISDSPFSKLNEYYFDNEDTGLEVDNVLICIALRATLSLISSSVSRFIFFFPAFRLTSKIIY